MNPVLDSTVFQTLFESTGADPAFMGELIDTFGSDAPRLFAELETALDVGDAATFRRAAHTLKSDGRTFGAVRFAALCLELEEMGKEGVLTEAELKLAAARDEYAQVSAALEAKRGELAR